MAEGYTVFTQGYEEMRQELRGVSFCIQCKLEYILAQPGMRINCGQVPFFVRGRSTIGTIRPIHVNNFPPFFKTDEKHAQTQTYVFPRELNALLGRRPNTAEFAFGRFSWVLQKS